MNGVATLAGGFGINSSGQIKVKTGWS
jgi:hypothetical protein